MSKTMRIIAVRKPNTAIAKKPIPEYDPTDIDLVVNMVNKASRQQEAERLAQAERDRLRLLDLREKDVARRERVIRRKEREHQSTNSLVNIVLDAALIGFAILGMATAIWFCWLF